jgi:dephospho-CoA kinase
MLKIGITGGIGSGKTTICRLFETLRVPIYYSDDAAKWLLQHNPEVRAQVSNLFGSTAYLPDGTLDRQALASVAFQNPEKMSLLESIVHPAVWQHSQQWLSQQAPNTPYIIKESALLFESGAYTQLDKIITVTAPIDLRIARVMQRDQKSEADIRQRIARQMPDEDKINRSDFVIYNDGTQALIPQVLHIHQTLIEYTQQA